MAPLKKKGDLAELKVACDLMDRGWGIAVPWGEDCDFDLIAYRGNELQRVQVKYTESDGRIVFVRCKSLSLTNGKVRQIKRYTAETIDWIAVYDKTTHRCYYVPATELGSGRELLSLRLVPTLNSQRIGVRFAEDYLEFGADHQVPARLPRMEPAGIEPATSSVQGTRSAN
jgi:PD-(D/E)XK endonuclease